MKAAFQSRAATLVVISLLCLGRAFAADPSDIFLKAYQEYGNAEKLERDGNAPQALAKYKETATQLESVRKMDAEWQPLVVEYRLKKTRDNIDRLTTQIASMPPPAVVSTQDDIEGPLPQAEPSVNLPPVVTVGPGATRRSSVRTSAPDTTNYDEDIIGKGGINSGDRETRTLSRQLAEVMKNNQSLNDKLLKQSAQLQSALVEVDKTKVTVVELRSQLAQSRDTFEDASRDASTAGIRKEYDSRIQEVLKELDAQRSDNEVMREENDKLYAKLDKAAAYIQASDSARVILDKDRTVVAEQRDENRKKIAKYDAIVIENKSLKEKIVKAGQSKSGAHDIAIAQLQDDLKDVTSKLEAAQSDLTTRKNRIKELEELYAKADAADPEHTITANPDQGKLAAENDLLKGILLRQIREQSQRDEARKLVNDEIATLHIKSEVLKQQIAVLAAPVLTLTDSEKSLFQEPVALLNEPTVSSMEVTMAITKPPVDTQKQEQPKTDSAAVDIITITPEPPKSESGVAIAVPGAKSAPEVLPDEVKPMVARAKELFDKKDYKGSERVYLSILEIVPSSHFALSNLGAVQFQLGKLDAAEITLKKAAEKKPDDSFAYTTLGMLYQSKTQYDEAIKVLEQSIQINEADNIAHNYLGLCLDAKGESAAAETQFKRAIELNDSYAAAYLNLAHHYAAATPPAIDLVKQHYAKATSLGAAPDASIERLIQ